MRPLALALAAALGVTATRARADIDRFEIQVYDATADAPGQPGLELHTNYVAKGLTQQEGTLLPADKVAHFTLEPSIGVLPFWEMGGYFETALRPDGTFDYAGVKLRSKFVTPPTWNEAHPHWRLGVNFEVSLVPTTYDPNRWGSEVRPIVAWENEQFEFAFNPIVDVAFAGDGWHHGPDFDPALLGIYKLDHVGLGLEYYAALGYFSGFSPLAQQEHYVYEVVNLLGVEGVEVNAGVGEGLTSASNRVVLKMILGYEF